MALYQESNLDHAGTVPHEVNTTDFRTHHLLDLLPGLGSQMQDPEIFVMIELFPIGRCKLPAKYPQLPTGCGHHCCLPGEEGRAGSDKGSENRDRRTLSLRYAAASKYQRAAKQQRLVLPCLATVALWG